MAGIEFVDVSKSFPGASRPAVDHVSFAVREGGICMLLGTSGSGKTTLLRMVNRLADPSSGKVLIDGVPTVEREPIELRRSIGYAIQQVGLFPHMTIEENVRVVPSMSSVNPPAPPPGASTSCSRSSASNPGSIASAIPASSAAASSSASAWRARWRPIHRCC